MWEMRFLHQAVPDVNYAVILSADFFHSFSCGLFIYFLLFFFIEEEENGEEKITCHWAINWVYWIYFSSSPRDISDHEED